MKAMQRRLLLRTAVALGTGSLLWPVARATALKPLGKPQPFDLAWLKGQARALAGRPYQAPSNKLPAAIAALNWDQYQAIRFKPEHALWADDKLRFKLELFHLGLFFKRPVQMFEVVGGQAQQLAYDPAMFDYGKSGIDGRKQPADLGFAGFRFKFHLAPEFDIAAFLGASYFRATSGTRQYGLSARGLAIDAGMPRPEEFPEFTSFWFERPAPDSNTLVVHALLDSPSVAGAYRFAITPGDTTLMEVDAALYPRKEIERLGIAPCTSMFQAGENDKRKGNDWRPEIHDSDGLSIHNGNGEWLWRPLRNPAHVSFNAFADKSPRGFGLLQRDKDFANYQDDGVFYDRRPSLWVEPKGDWGAGAVDLVEIPTDNETNDNIVAFWNPAAKPQPGQELLIGYRLYWGRDAPTQSPLARTVATRTGIGGVVGKDRTYFSWRFAVDFAGGNFALLDPRTKVEAVVTATRGRIETTSARPLDAIHGWRAIFDVVPDANSMEPIALRLFLRADGQPLTETWLYEYAPPPLNERPLQ
ncbi:Glucan biosynthesis protein D OS=Rhizobacter sp. Root404 OX=1736528 GN=ASC76_08660 PE=3 SV=1 [Rhizobacter fulvus]|jgi:glucans biosynthesis protein